MKFELDNGETLDTDKDEKLLVDRHLTFYRKGERYYFVDQPHPERYVRVCSISKQDYQNIAKGYRTRFGERRDRDEMLARQKILDFKKKEE